MTDSHPPHDPSSPSSPQATPSSNSLDHVPLGHAVEAEIVGTADESQPQKPRRRGRPLLAWIAITAAVLLVMFMPRGAEPADDATSSLETLGLRILEIQAKYLVGAAEVAGVDGERLYRDAGALNVGSPAQRLRVAVLAGELAGPAEALDVLEQLNTKLQQHPDSPHAQLSSDQLRAAALLEQLYRDYAHGQWNNHSLTADERVLLEQQLGWFGALALHPESSDDEEGRQAVIQPAILTMALAVLAVLFALALGTAGLVAAIIFATMYFHGSLHSRLQAGSLFGGVYAETFAIWFALFLGLGIAASLLPLPVNPLAANLAVACGSLAALGWPLVRGLSWQELREQIGWTSGRGLGWEVLWGIGSYIATLPLLMIGLIVVLVLMSIANLLFGSPEAVDPFGQPPVPHHPIVQWVTDSGWTGKLLIAVMACVMAPVVEETMFRGVLYRHLRDSTARWRITSSVIFSGLVNSFIFAVIHPQGLLAVPALMSLALGFSLAREWRGSLIASMTAHATNNGILTAFLLLIV